MNCRLQSTGRTRLGRYAGRPIVEYEYICVNVRCRRMNWSKDPAGRTRVSGCPGDESRGLGDSVAKATRAAGINPCGGCKKRQRKLNELFPYG